MDPLTIEQEQEAFISKCSLIFKSKGFDIQPQFISTASSHSSHSTIEIHRNYLNFLSTFGQTIDDLALDQVLFQGLADANQLLFVKKQREQQNDFKIARQRKEARSKLYKKQKINEYSFKNIESIEKFFYQKSRECSPLKMMIKERITSLKAIYIQYELKINSVEYLSQYFYSISAFQFFKVIHQNRELTDVTLKGVYLQNFGGFLSQIRALKNKAERFNYYHTVENEWIEYFNPSKLLKLSINADLNFSVLNKSKSRCLSNLSDLVFFIQMLFWLSDITIRIQLDYADLDRMLYVGILHNLLLQLKSIRKVKIVISKDQLLSQIPIFLQQRVSFHESIPQVRSVLFGGLASFTEITSLFFKSIKFNQNARIVDFLGIEQSLVTLFKNNPITHLKLNSCKNFPLLPQMKTLRKLELSNSTFRRNTDCLGKLVPIDSNLIFFRCFSQNHRYTIDEQLFSRLQTLIIKYHNQITFNISQNTPSKIKNLIIENTSKNKGIFILSIMLPKLYNLIYLKLSHIDTDYVLLCTIPSTHLTELFLKDNRSITNQGLIEINLKWPYLKILGLYGCVKLVGNVWGVLLFNELMKLQIDTRIDKEIDQQLKRRGLIVY